MTFLLPDPYITEGAWDGVQRNFQAIGSLLGDVPWSWHELGVAGEPAFAGTFVNSGGAFETAAFRLINPRVVALKGTIRGSAVNGAPAVFTLPAAYRPAKERRIPTWVSDAGATIYAALLIVAPAGTVSLYSLALAATAITDGGLEATFAL